MLISFSLFLPFHSRVYLTVAWLNNKKEKGFYIGTVEAVDLDKHQYWVTFDKPGIYTSIKLYVPLKQVWVNTQSMTMIFR